MKVETGFHDRFAAVQGMKSAVCMSLLEINDFCAAAV
jgi:hypothetical protein